MYTYKNIEVRHTSIHGAYFYPKRYQIILVFDDEIGMFSPFRVSCKNKKSSTISIINGGWQHLGVMGGGREGEINVVSSGVYGFVWIFTFSNQSMEGEEFTEIFLTVKPEWIVSSNSETKLDRIIQMNCAIKELESEKGILILQRERDKKKLVLILKTLF